MAFPWTAHENFEAGTVGIFSGTGAGDTEIAHWTKLGRHWDTGPTPMPYEGAYALTHDLASATADNYIQDDTNFDLALSGNLFIRVVFALSPDLVMATGNRFTFFSMQSAGPTDEIVLDIRNNSGTYEVLASETGASATVRANPVTLGKHHVAELDDQDEVKQNTRTATVPGFFVTRLVIQVKQRRSVAERIDAD